MLCRKRGRSSTECGIKWGRIVCSTSSELTRYVREDGEGGGYIVHFIDWFWLQDIKAYQALPLPGYVVTSVSEDLVNFCIYKNSILCVVVALSLSLSLSLSQDQGNCTIQLLHPSNKKELCDTFKVEDATAFIKKKKKKNHEFNIASRNTWMVKSMILWEKMFCMYIYIYILYPAQNLRKNVCGQWC